MPTTEHDSRHTYEVLQIGCGPTGTSLARQLLPALAANNVPVHYTVAEPTIPGPGLAFSTRYETHLLNVPAGAISLHPANRREFMQWRSEHADAWRPRLRRPELGWGDYPPRQLFGQYAQFVWDAAVTDAEAQGQRVTVVGDRVVRLVAYPAASQWSATFASGESRTFDRVLLALGHLPSSTYTGLAESPRHVANPWSARNIEPEATVGVIGTRLTAIDSALALQEDGHLGRVTLASRTGWLPSVKGEVADHELRHIPHVVADCVASGRRLDLAAVADLVRREIREVESRDIDWAAALNPPPTTRDRLLAEVRAAESGDSVGWQSVLAAVVPWVSAIWQVTDERSRTDFLARHLSAWAIRVAPFPAISARRLLDAMDCGMLTVTGGLADVEYIAGEGYRLRRSDGTSIDVDWIINGTGPGFGLDSLAGNPLTRQLLADGLAVPHPDGGVMVDEASYRVLDVNGETLNGVHAIGDITRGVWIATNAVENTVAQAASVARVVTESLCTSLIADCRTERVEAAS